MRQPLPELTWSAVASQCTPGTPAERFVALCRDCPQSDLYLDIFKAIAQSRLEKANPTPEVPDAGPVD